MNRKSTTGGLKLLVDSGVLSDTLDRLTGCAELLAQNATGSTALTAICYLLIAITKNLQNEILSSLDVEARKRNRQRT